MPERRKHQILTCFIATIWFINGLKFAGPLPFTFIYNPETKNVLIIEGVRENWIPQPVQVLDYHFSFLNKMNLQDVRLANSFIIENIPYHWKKDRLEQWKGA